MLLINDLSALKQLRLLMVYYFCFDISDKDVASNKRSGKADTWVCQLPWPNCVARV